MKFSDLTVGRIIHYTPTDIRGQPLGCRAAIVVQKNRSLVYVRVFECSLENDVVRMLMNVEDGANWHDPRECPENLSQAVQEVLQDHPLPRCRHGKALQDHSGAMLQPSCGCFLLITG